MSAHAPRAAELRRQQISSDRIGAPSGHFSQAIAADARGRLVFISGMTSKRADGSVAGVGDIEAQTRQMCENVKAAVEAAGGTMADICRVDVYVKDMADFDAIHRVRREYFPAPPPASTMVQVSGFTHRDYLIEMNAIAVVG
ncbi:MAG TPA: RidA family protein [Acetobacteraceae bacterium]|jgi:reactive intermediate/imine deaminase